jgi:hypothetical protein
MKKIYLTLLSCFIAVVSMAQTPGFSYQAVILNPDVQSLPGNNVEQGLLSESDISIRFTIENEFGTEYQETHTTKTDAYGMVNLMVGQGMATIGNFTEVAWVGAEKYLKVEIDFTASGASYESLDRQALTYLPQPLSLESNNRINELELAINTVAADLITIELTQGPQGVAGTDGIDGINGTNGTNGAVGQDGVGIAQNLSISGDTLFISSGNYIVLPSSVPCNDGCMDISAYNYDAAATCDDGSCIAVVLGCTDSTAPNYYPLANTDDGSCIVIGSSYVGGIVFYLDGNGGGLIAAPSDQSIDAEWGCYGTSILGADGTAIGTGNQNTIDIVNANCSPNTSGNLIAANICDTLTLGGYSDWFLPSKDELNEMYLNIGQGNALGLGNIGGFSTNVYRSSTEAAANVAWGQYFFDGHQGGYNKYFYFNASVRAVRAF